MARRFAFAATILMLTALLSATIYAAIDEMAAPAKLTVHEWGTFTSVAGPNGQAAQWLPLAGPNDLPCFVESYQNRLYKSIGPLFAEVQRNPVTYAKARTELLGPIRMETPVLYFYSDKAQKVNVRVAFPKGFVTEWYPRAVVNQTPVRQGVLSKSANTGASITWKGIEVLPRDSRVNIPTGSSKSHYYAARETDANPIRVGGQDEKFLFYRGVGGFPIPLNVTVSDGGRIRIKHLAGKPHVILFENRGGRMGYTVVDTSRNEVVLDTPPLTGNFESLRAELESALVAEGLFAREAAAMVETWRDSWFEEGTRLFYIVPPAMVDAILPLTIEPRPESVARTFVGRVEIFTPETLSQVEAAVASNDTSVLAAYGRFLGPIMERIPESKRSNNVLDSAFREYINQAAACSK